VLRRLRLVGIFAGIVATSAAFWLLSLVVGLPLFPNLYPEGVIPTGFAWYVHAALATIPPLLSLLLTFFLGGWRGDICLSGTERDGGCRSDRIRRFPLVRGAIGALDVGAH
jgi:hypothetical protein